MSEHSVAATLFGKTQRGLLSLFFVQPERSFYLRQIVRMAKVGQGAAQRELARWTEAGILIRTRRGNQVCYQANSASPVFPELKSLVLKTVGLADVLRDSLSEMADRIAVAFIHGSVARHAEKSDSDVDLVVVGGVTFGEVAAAIHSAQQIIGREINPTVYPAREFRAKLRSKHHFVTSLKDASKIFLLGGDLEFQRLGT